MAQNFTDLTEPFILSFPKAGNGQSGFISSTQVAENMPFQIQRVFWTYDIPDNTQRGNHANFKTREVLIAVQGCVHVKTETKAGKNTFTLSDPETGLYIPELCWADLYFSENALVVCLASTEFNEQDYIRDYTEFKKQIEIH